VADHRGVGDRQSIHDELEWALADLHQLVSDASPAALAQRTTGTRWTNGQMLWHMSFGYLIVWRLLPLVRFFGRLPDWFARAFAAVLNAATRPFHVVNYLGSVGGALVFRGPRLTSEFDRTITRLHRRLDAETPTSLGRRMHFPTGWDPFFRDTMTLAEVYHYGTQHYEFHRAQLTLGPSSGPPRTASE
jgi:hypothetical protein